MRYLRVASRHGALELVFAHDVDDATLAFRHSHYTPKSQQIFIALLQRVTLSTPTLLQGLHTITR